MLAVAGLHRNVVFLWIVAGALALLAIVGYCRRPAQSALPPEVKELRDSLRNTRLQSAATIDSLRRTSEAADQRAESIMERARVVESTADQARRDAERHARDAIGAKTAEDSAKAWRAAYESRTAEADSLRIASATKDSAFAAKEAARQAIQSALAESESRRRRSEQLNDDLSKAIEKQARGCRVLALIKCPSRTVVGITAFVAGAATYAVVSAGRP